MLGPAAAGRGQVQEVDMLDAAPAPRVSARRSGSRRRWWYRPETAGDLGLPDPVPHAPPMDAEFPMDAELVGDLFDRARARRRVPADIHRSTISATAHGRRAARGSASYDGILVRWIAQLLGDAKERCLVTTVSPTASSSKTLNRDWEQEGDVGPEQRGQAAAVRVGQLRSAPVVGEHVLHHQGVDVDRAACSTREPCCSAGTCGGVARWPEAESQRYSS